MARSFDVSVQTNAAEVSAFLARYRRDQIPFATAFAQTRTARRVRDDARRRVFSFLTIRSRGLPKRIVSTQARKRDFPNSSAEIRVLEDALADHAIGVVRRSRSGGRIPIPTRAVKRTATGRIPKRLRPRTLLAREGHFKTSEGGAGQIQRTTGKGGRRDRRRILHLLRNRVRIDKVWPFVEDALSEARAIYPEEFRIRFLQAIKDARPPKL